MPLRRFGRPGLLGLAARTAVVAGTASAVTGAAQRHQARRAQKEYEQQQYEAAQQQAQVEATVQNMAAPPAAPTPAPAAGDDLIAKLQQLASMQQAGVLSAEEFAAAKQKLLGT
ncbi:SHOCT domain-containing protein [Microbacterium paraoxydans]|uniref:SHOCT domain-containing protein n=1 Tax=Microbacterium paraoxydans TaxID=199592 RepID=UPI003D76642C